MKSVKIYFGVHMGASHKTLATIHKKTLEKDECALFVNRSMTAAKALYRGGLILYLKPPAGACSIDDLINMAAPCGGKKLVLGSAGVNALQKFAEKISVKNNWVAKVMSA